MRMTHVHSYKTDEIIYADNLLPKRRVEVSCILPADVMFPQIPELCNVDWQSFFVLFVHMHKCTLATWGLHLTKPIVEVRTKYWSQGVERFVAGYLLGHKKANTYLEKVQFFQLFNNSSFS